MMYTSYWVDTEVNQRIFDIKSRKSLLCY